MRVVWPVVVALSLLAGFPTASTAAADSAPGLALTNVSHTLDGRALAITGWVENRGKTSVGRLVVDASGFMPSGDLTAFGSDGIPWEIAPGGAERFTIRLPIAGELVHDYVVQVSLAQFPIRPLAGVRRSVDLALYRPLLLSLVQVTGNVRPGLLILHSSVSRLPVKQVTTEVTLLLIDPAFQILRTFTVNVPADGTTVIPLGSREAILVTVRVVDLLLRANWTN